MTPAGELTDLQEAVMEYLVAYASEHEIPPTIQEIQEHFYWNSKNSAVAHLDALQEKGFISRVKGGHRTIRVLSKWTNRADLPPSVE